MNGRNHSRKGRLGDWSCEVMAPKLTLSSPQLHGQGSHRRCGQYGARRRLIPSQGLPRSVSWSWRRYLWIDKYCAVRGIDQVRK